jgi:queuosine precursor transporter
MQPASPGALGPDGVVRGSIAGAAPADALSGATVATEGPPGTASRAAPPLQPGRRALLPAATVPRLAIVVVGAYVGAQVIADIASVKVGSTFGRAVDMGTFIYPITFTLRDVVHKMLGRRAARTLIVTAAFVNLFMALYLQWAARAPSDESYPLGDEFQAVLGPLWRIVVASIIAEVVSELLDTEVYHWFVRRVTTRFQWARVAVSNAVSIPVDNALFAVIAFGSLPFLTDHALTLPWSAVWDIFIVNLVVKGAVSAASMPLIYLSPDRDWRADPGDA